MQKEVKIILSLSLVVVLLVIIFVILGSKASTSVTPTSVSKLIENATHMTGKSDAKVTIVEFGDYECPACGQFNPTADQLIATYGKDSDFNFVFRNFPLPQHKNAAVAAEAAEAANVQGKFLEMKSKLYSNQDQWTESENPIDIFAGYAEELGLNVSKFKSEVLANKYQDIITKDLSLGSEIGVSWTPSIYVNGELLQTLPSFDEMKTRIDNLLK